MTQLLINLVRWFYVLATSKATSEQVLTSDSALSWRLYRTTALADQAAGIMI